MDKSISKSVLGFKVSAESMKGLLYPASRVPISFSWGRMVRSLPQASGKKAFGLVCHPGVWIQMGGISEIMDQVKLLILSIYTEIFPVA